MAKSFCCRFVIGAFADSGKGHCPLRVDGSVLRPLAAFCNGPQPTPVGGMKRVAAGAESLCLGFKDTGCISNNPSRTGEIVGS